MSGDPSWSPCSAFGINLSEGLPRTLSVPAAISGGVFRFLPNTDFTNLCRFHSNCRLMLDECEGEFRVTVDSSCSQSTPGGPLQAPGTIYYALNCFVQGCLELEGKVWRQWATFYT